MLQRIDLDDFDAILPSKRAVFDYKIYSSRLKEVDYEFTIQSGFDWKDPSFPPDMRSIVDESLDENRHLPEWETLCWKRPKDVYGKQNIPFTIFETIGPNDVKQGRCGDCYFLASLSSLAEYPDRVKNIFITKEVNEAGCYAVNLFVNGERRTVVVDDYFPYDEDNERWAFSRPSEEEDEKNGKTTKEIWVLILEKAWAKVYGSYQRIEAGLAGEAFNALTGCPHRFYRHSAIKEKDALKERNRLFATILQADKLKYPMCAAVAARADDGLNEVDVDEAGLQDEHCYSLIGATVLKLDNGKEERLIKIRNPQGRKEWTGDWCDSSPRWTPATKAQVNLVEEDDGTFWIAFKDYISFFYLTTICHHDESSQGSAIADQHEPDGFGLAGLDLAEDHTEPITFSINQYNERLVDQAVRRTYRYPSIKLILTQVVQSEDKEGKTRRQQVFVHGTFEAGTPHCMISFSSGLPKGRYILMYQSKFPEEHEERKLVVTLHARQGMELHRTDETTYTEYRWL